MNRKIVAIAIIIIVVIVTVVIVAVALRHKHHSDNGPSPGDKCTHSRSCSGWDANHLISYEQPCLDGVYGKCVAQCDKGYIPDYDQMRCISDGCTKALSPCPGWTDPSVKSSFLPCVSGHYGPCEVTCEDPTQTPDPALKKCVGKTCDYDNRFTNSPYSSTGIYSEGSPPYYCNPITQAQKSDVNKVCEFI
jgi:hypothetical protein